MAVTGTTDKVYSADELLSRSKTAVATSKKGSTIQKMLEGRPEITDTVSLSPVQKLAKAQETAKPKESYFDSDTYLTSKIAQLRMQIGIYSQMPGLDSSGEIMKSLGKQVGDLVSKQQAKLKASREAADAKQKELDAAQDPFKDLMKPEELLTRSLNAATGVKSQTALSKQAQALLDKSAKSVNKSV